MTTSDNLLVVEVMYHHIDRIGMVPQVNKLFPCDEAPRGSVLVIDKAPLMRAGQPVGWVLKGLR